MKRVPQRGGGGLSDLCMVIHVRWLLCIDSPYCSYFGGGGGGGMAVVDDADLKTVEYMQVFYF